MLKNQLQNFGLTKTQSAVFGFLLENGEKKASEIAKGIAQPRGAVYKSLDELLALELVSKTEKDKEVARFRVEHPRKLETILENQIKKAEQNKKTFEDVLPEFISTYNLALNRPGVRFFEGREGLEKVLYDTLKSKTEVYLMFNRDAMMEEEIFKNINEEYKKQRIRTGITKKIIRLGEKPELTFGTRDDKYDALTEIRYLEKSAFPFKTNIHIYDGKISFLIMDQGKIIGILIEDKHIYELNKFWFETLWELAKN